jgi:stress-induced morphogen
MALKRKLTRVLTDAFPPPDKVRLRDEDRIIGIITSERFRNVDLMDRQTLIQDILAKRLSKEEMKHILVLVAVTPEEERAHSAAD